MNQRGFVFTTTTMLVVAILVVSISTLSVITASYIASSINKTADAGKNTTSGTDTPPSGGTPNHLECRNSMCVLVAGTGVNSCVSAGSACGTSSGGSSSGSSGGSSGGNNPSPPTPTLVISVPSSGQVFASNISLPLNFSILYTTASTCRYAVDNGANVTFSDCKNTTFDAPSNGSHSIKVTAQTSSGNLSDTNSFSIVTNGPALTLSSPENGSFSASSTLTFTYIASEQPASDLASCELWGNFNGTYMKNQTNASVVSGATSQFSVDTLKNGTYLWAVSCVDEENHRSTAGNWTVTVDTVPPVVSLSEPKGVYARNSLVPLNFSVQDAAPATCWYNVTPITGGAAVIARNAPGCINTSINLADGNYTLVFQAQAGGLTSYASTNFVVNTSGLATLLSFIPPTPLNGSTINASDFTVNVSAIDTLSRYVAVDFNHTFMTWVRMDDTMPDGSISDTSAYPSSVETSGTTVVPGKFGSALRFGNSSDGLKITDSPVIDFIQEFTVSFWFNGNSSAASQPIMSKWDGTTSGEIAWEVSLATGGACDGLDFYVSHDGSSSDRVYARKCNQTYQDGQWHHVVGVFNGGKNITLYVDKDASGATIVGNISDITSVHQNNQDLYIGSRLSGTYNGSIDEVLLFSRALTSQEVGALFGAGNSPYWNDFTNLTDGTYAFRAYSVNTAGIQSQTESRTITVSGGCTIGCSPPIDSSGSSLLRKLLWIHVVVLAGLYGILVARLYLKHVRNRSV